MAQAAAQNAYLEPKQLSSFADEADRTRLTAAALKAFKKVTEVWALTNVESAAVLGVSGSTWDRIKRGERSEMLSQDQLTRVSATLGIFKGLHLLFADQMADRWPKLANTGPLFGGRTPVTTMIDDGIPVMLDIRRYIDAVRGGL